MKRGKEKRTQHQPTAANAVPSFICPKMIDQFSVQMYKSSMLTVTRGIIFFENWDALRKIWQNTCDDEIDQYVADDVDKHLVGRKCNLT